MHRRLSYKLLFFMVMYTGPVCISICSPVPPPRFLGAWHSSHSYSDSWLLQTGCPFLSHSHRRSGLFLPVASDVAFYSCWCWYVCLLHQAVATGGTKPCGPCGRHLHPYVFSLAKPYPSCGYLGNVCGMNKRQVWMPLDLVSSMFHTGVYI